MDSTGYNFTDAQPEQPVKKMRKSAAGRQLVRWNPDMDQLLLLCIDATCAKKGIPLPWDDIAKSAVPYLTGEGVKQHLAKLYKAREACGQAVPEKIDKNTRRNALKAANATKYPAATANALEQDDEDDEDNEPFKNSSLLWFPTKKAKTTTKKAARAPATAAHPITSASNSVAIKQEADDSDYVPHNNLAARKRRKYDLSDNEDDAEHHAQPFKKSKPTVPVREKAPFKYSAQMVARPDAVYSYPHDDIDAPAAHSNGFDAPPSYTFTNNNDTAPHDIGNAQPAQPAQQIVPRAFNHGPVNTTEVCDNRQWIPFHTDSGNMYLKPRQHLLVSKDLDKIAAMGPEAYNEAVMLRQQFGLPIPQKSFTPNVPDIAALGLSGFTSIAIPATSEPAHSHTGSTPLGQHNHHQNSFDTVSSASSFPQVSQDATNNFGRAGFRMYPDSFGGNNHFLHPVSYGTDYGSFSTESGMSSAIHTPMATLGFPESADNSPHAFQFKPHVKSDRLSFTQPQPEDEINNWIADEKLVPIQQFNMNN